MLILMLILMLVAVWLRHKIPIPLGFAKGIFLYILLSLRAKRGNPDLFGIIIYWIAAVVTLPRNDKERIINRPPYRRGLVFVSLVIASECVAIQ